MTLASETLVFARCVGFVYKAPGFSNKAVPQMIRAVFAFMMAALIAPSVHIMPATDSSSFIFTVIGEIVIGATIGYAASVLYDGIEAGGQAQDDFVGIRGINPASNPSAGALAGIGFGRLWAFTFVMAYFQLGGYALPLMVFADGLREVPPGALFDPTQWMTFLFRFPAYVLKAAMVIVAPVYLVGVVTQFALAAISRIAPKFSTQSITFGVAFAVVMLVVIVMLPLTLHIAEHPWMPLPLPGAAPMVHR